MLHTYEVREYLSNYEMKFKNCRKFNETSFRQHEKKICVNLFDDDVKTTTSVKNTLLNVLIVTVELLETIRIDMESHLIALSSRV